MYGATLSVSKRPRSERPDRVELVTALTERFGKEFVKVRTEHHVQVIFGKVKHDVWMTKDKIIKYKLHGQGGPASRTNLDNLLNVIDQHKPDASDLARMREAHELAESINEAQSRLKSLGLKAAVFCDAGVRDGLAKMGYIYVAQTDSGPTITAHVWHARCSIETAEYSAIFYAVEEYRGEPDLPIFSDNQQAVDKAKAKHGDRINWLPRGKNKIADKIANLRGGHGKAAVQEAAAKAPNPEIAAPWEDVRGEGVSVSEDPEPVPGSAVPEARGAVRGSGKCDPEPPAGDEGSSAD